MVVTMAVAVGEVVSVMAMATVAMKMIVMMMTMIIVGCKLI